MSRLDREGRYAFVVYDPPAPGLPWLSVCIGPDGKLRAVEAFDTLAGAHARTAECAEMLRAGRINALSIVPTLARVLLQNAALFRGAGAFGVSGVAGTWHGSTSKAWT